VYDYALKNKELSYKDFGDIKKIKLNTTDWETITEPAVLTFTLGF
jgi:hypothetical protein